MNTSKQGAAQREATCDHDYVRTDKICTECGEKVAAGAAVQPEPAYSWRPIKTAPRDGTNILIRFGRDGVSQAKYVPGTPHPWKFIDTNDGVTWLINHAVDTAYGPSHWMPIPSAYEPEPGIVYAAPVPSQAASVSDGWAQGVEAVAKMLDKKADDYAREYGSDDMGSLSFGTGKHADAKRDYHWSLVELAEEVRGMVANHKPACDRAPEGWQCSRGAGHSGPCAASASTVAAPQPAATVSDEHAEHFGSEISQTHAQQGCSAPIRNAATVSDLPEWFDAFLTNVCEIPDRNSRDDEPDAIVATLEELKSCALNAIESTGPSTGICFFCGEPINGQHEQDCPQLEARAASTARATPDPTNGIPATLTHDEGSIARCSYCGRYSLDPKTLSDRQPKCECGEKHGWSGSFKKPGPDAKWSGAAPAIAEQAAPQAAETPKLPQLKPRLLNPLRRFNECCEDSEADGHDVDKEDMHSLAEMGAVRPAPGGRHYLTDFGHYLLAAPLPHASEQADEAVTEDRRVCDHNYVSGQCKKCGCVANGE